jgi:catechol-2,3-dioxygenase
MAILGSIPVFNCHSIDETLSFYQQLLQFVIVNKREKDNQLQWVHIMHGDTSLMLQSVDSQAADMPKVKESKINLYFYVNNINDLHHYIKAKYNTVSQVVETDYRMHEFFLIDPEGNKVIVGQKL